MSLPPRRTRQNEPFAVERNYRRGPKLVIHPLVLLITLIITFAVILLVGVLVVTSHSVTIVVEGVRREVRTNQATVAGLLTELALLIEPQDVITPAGNTPLTNGLTITIDKAHQVVVEADGEVRRVLTHLTHPRDILAEAGIHLGPHDEIIVNGTPIQLANARAIPRSLRVERAITLTLSVDGTQSTLYTVARTVGAALHDAKVSLFLADKITPDLAVPISDGDVIVVERSIPFTLEFDGRTLKTRTHGKTVGEALAESGIALVGLDYTVPDESAPLTPDSVVRIVRVTEEDEIERLEIDFREEVRTDTDIPPETQRIIQEGIKGILERRIRVRREDGIEVSRSSPQDIVLREPQTRIVAIGATPSLLITPSPTLTRSGS